MAEEDFEEQSPSGMRSFWTGTITFGLVSVPVSLFPATRPRAVSLKMVTEEGTPLRRRYVCSKDGKELDNDEIVRGYEIEKGKYVVVTDDELEAIEPRKSREIDLQLFVDRDEIDPMYFERAYFLTPSGGSNKAYRLLAEVMEQSGRAGIASFVMRAKEYLVAILAENGILRAETLRFADEIRTAEDIGLPDTRKPKPAEVKKFEQVIAKRSGKVDFSEFLDESLSRLQDVVEKKRRQGTKTIKAVDDAEEGGGEVIDLLAILSRSLNAKQPKAAAKSRSARAPREKASSKTKRSPAKRTATKRKTAKSDAKSRAR